MTMQAVLRKATSHWYLEAAEVKSSGLIEGVP